MLSVKGIKATANYRKISLRSTSIPGKLFRREFYERVNQMTEYQIDDKQDGRGCVDQVLGLKMCEKYLGKGRYLCVAFMDLEKAYEEINRNAMWQVYWVGGKVVRTVKNFYQKRLIYMCVSPRICVVIFMGGVVNEMKAKFREQRARIVYGSERKWELSQLLTGDTTFIVYSGEKL